MRASHPLTGQGAGEAFEHRLIHGGLSQGLQVVRGYNPKYWTEQAEDWYQRCHIVSLQLGLAHLKSNKVWTKELHQGKVTN